MNLNTRTHQLLILLMLLALPWLTDNTYTLHIAITVLLYAILSMSLNIISGMAGQICVGHAAFYGIGAYAATLLMVDSGWSFFSSALSAGLITALFGTLLGSLSIRIKGNYLCIVTLGFGEIILLALLNWSSLTKGAMGITHIPSPSLFSWQLADRSHFFYLTLMLFSLSFYLIRRLENSALGIAMLAINNDEIAAKSVGIPVATIKIIAFSLGAFFAGICGSLFASYTAYINPASFGFSESIAIMCMVMIGGRGNTIGAVLGAVLLTLLPEMLRITSDYRLILYGCALMISIILKPDGIYGIRYREGIRL